MTPPPDDTFASLRAARDALRSKVGDDQRALADAERRLRDATRAHGDEDRRTRALREARDAMVEAVASTHGAHQDAAGRFDASLRDRLLDVDIQDDFEKLNSSAPLVLLPVRIETRFALGGREKQLWIRVYPDEIHGDGHEPALTDDEVSAGTAYWNALWDDASKHVEAWKVLVDRLTATRAAWVARTLTPLNPDADHAVHRPLFPAPSLRTDAWTRAVEARLLPDRWVALGLRGGKEVARATGSAIVEPLALTVAPDAPDAAMRDVSGDGLLIDDGVRWTVDFARAKEVGMAIEMPLSADDVRDGFEQLLVVGVKGSLSATESGTALGALFDAHHYQRGLAFVRQGTPTNNTQAAPSGFPPSDNGALTSFAIERDAARSIAGRDGERMATALGLPADTFTHVARSDADEQAGARAMCGALWPATWGYFFEELLFEDEHDDDVEQFRKYWIDHVRPRGPLPAFRVGGTPYGVVVTSSLTHWVQRNHRGMMQLRVPLELRRLREFWRRAAPRVAHVGRSNDPDRDLLDILEMDASARDVRVRTVLGPNASLNMAAFFGLDWSAAKAEQVRLAQDLAVQFDSPSITSRIFALMYGKEHPSFVKGFVVPKPAADAEEALSETDPLQPFNYIRWLREAPSIDDVREQRLPAGVSPPNTLLYLLLRHAMMREAARTADTILVKEGLMVRDVGREVEFPGHVQAAPASTSAEAVGAPEQKLAGLTSWQRLQQVVPNVTNEVSLATFIWSPVTRPDHRRIQEFREFLLTLENLPTAELERLLTETLDACSHRLDAWVTAMFTERLTSLRGAETPRTVLGGFGWVTNLRARPAVEHTSRVVDGIDDFMRRRLDVPRGASLDEQTSTGGYIHAPSMAQAATAAILRNGYLSRRHVDGDRYGVDLSSTRVRHARWVLDAVRNGQPLGAVLGYQFERGLHEGHPGRELDKFIEPFRAEFPLNVGQLTPTEPGEAVETITARHVVHGLRLLEAFKAQPQTIPWGQRGLPPASGPDFEAVVAELRALDETVDAVADLLLAESVHQLVRGNTSGASASLDALSRGARPPDPDVIRSPRGGSALVHRVAMLVDPGAALPATWAAVPASARSAAEPCLDAWFAQAIGDPAKVRCAVTYTDAAAGVIGPVEVTLADLGLRAIDLYYALSADVAGDTRQPGMANTTAQGSELDARITARVLAFPGAAPHGEVKIRYAPTDRVNTRSFPEIAEVLRAAQSVLSTARSLAPGDLVSAEQRPLLGTAVVDQAELQGRANTAVGALTAARDAIAAAIAPMDVDPVPIAQGLRTTLVAALRGAAAFGVPRAFAPSPHNESDAEAHPARATDLLVLAKGVATELERRRVDAIAATSPEAALNAVFGTTFRTLTRFVPATDVLDQALAVGPQPAPSAADMREWLRGAALVRAPLDRWLAFTRLTAASGAAAPTLKVSQLPHAASASWVALPFAEDKRPPSGTVGLALLGPVPLGGSTWTGLLLDEWTELIPNKDESTALTFHYDDPGAEAPQAVLIAVAPDDRKQWSLETVKDILVETLEMARLRAVDRDLLGELEQFLPATFMAANARNDTIATDVRKHLALDATIVRGT